MKKIAVLITVFNRKDKTLTCLDALYRQYLSSNYIVDVFLVDDGCTDGTPEAVATSFPDVTIVNGNGSLFWNRGMHLAWKTASECADYDYYLWLNDDVILYESAMTDVLASVDSNTPSLVCGAIESKIDGSFTYGVRDSKGREVIPNGDVQYNGHFINGNFVLVSKSSFDLIGNLDEIFPHAIGDHDYGLRLLSQGGKIITTSHYVGTCERNARLPLWCYSSTPLLSRLKYLYSPLGYAHPIYFFIYEKRHFGIWRASKHFITIHLRTFIPSLWKN